MRRTGSGGLAVSRMVVLGLLVALATLSPGRSQAADEDFPSVTLWPLVYHRAGTQSARTDVIYPVFHYKREGSHSRFAIRPFLFNRERDPAKEFSQVNVLWPLSHFESQGEQFERYVFPLYYQKQAPGRSSLHIWPFFGHSLGDGDETWSTLYPFFQYTRNDEQEMRRFDYLWPLGRSVREPGRSSDYFIPLWWREKTAESSGGFVIPYFWYESETTRHDAILPLWYRGRTPQADTDVVVPLWLSYRRDGNSFRTLFPLYWHRDDGEARSWNLVLPLYGDYRSPSDDYRLFFPFYFRHQDIEADSELRYYFPFYGSYRKGGTLRHRYYLFPLYAHIEDSEAAREAWYFLWPLVYRETLPEERQTWVIPFYWMKQNPQRSFRALLLPPYYSYADVEGRRTLHVWPFYGVSQDPDSIERSVAWPLVGWGSNNAGERWARAIPVYWMKENPQRRYRLLLVPPYYSYRDVEGKRRIFFWPFYGLAQDPEYTERSVAWPLFRWGGSPDGERWAWQVLLLYGEGEPQQRRSGFFPLWHYDRNEKRTRTISLLHWQETKSTGKKFSLLHLGQPDWSLFTTRVDKEERHNHLFPLYSYTRNDPQKKRTLHVVWPLYRYAAEGEEASSHRFLWKFLYADRTPEKSEKGFLWRLIRSKHDAGGDLFECNPFYYSETHSDGESYVSWLGGLYARREGSDGVRRTLFWFIHF